MNVRNRFGRGGCFTCRMCKKKTRNVEYNAEVEFCPLCNAKALNGNSLSDAGFNGNAWAVFDGCKTVLECDNLLTLKLEELNKGA